MNLWEYNRIIRIGTRSVSTAESQSELITSQLLERDVTKKALLAGVERLAKCCGNPRLDKTAAPLLCTTGIGGSGKSTLCNLIRFDIQGCSWKAEVLETIRTYCRDPFKPKHLVVVMASLRQSTRYEATEDPTLAVIARCYADYTMADFRPVHSRKLPPELRVMDGFLDVIRQRERQIRDATLGRSP